MNQILYCDWLPERARWSYLTRSGQPRVLQEKFPLKSYNKSFIDQACSVKMTGYWPYSFFESLWTMTPSLFINTQIRTWPISSHLDWTSLVNNPYINPWTACRHLTLPTWVLVLSFLSDCRLCLVFQGYHYVEDQVTSFGHSFQSLHTQKNFKITSGIKMHIHIKTIKQIRHSQK